MTPNDEPFQEAELDAQLDALAHSGDESPTTPMSRAYRGLTQLYAPQAAWESQAIERVRQRLAAHAATPDAPLASSERAPAPLIVPDQANTLLWHGPRPLRRVSRLRTFMSGAAAVLAVGFLLGGYLAVLHARQATPLLTTYHWHVIPSPNTALAVNALTGITVRTSTDAWAWGTANVAPTNSDSNPIVMPLVEHWDGRQWRIVATPQPPEGGQLTDIVALAADNAWAVGQQLTGGQENTSNAPLVEHWDGHQWTVVPDDVSYWPNPSDLAKLAVLSADDIWAVGSAGDGAHSGLIQHWDGRTWQSVAHPAPPSGVQFSGITALAPDDIWVAGSGNNRGSGGAVFEHWDGRQWRIVSGPDAGRSHLTGIAAVAANDVWAVGVQTVGFPQNLLGPGEEPFFEHWNGQRWSIVDSPAVTATVSAIVALGPDDVWAVGTLGGGGDVAQQGQGLVEHWDGQRWSLIANPSPRPFTALSGVARDPSAPGKVWIVGTTGPALSGPDQLTDVATLIETTQ